MCFSTPKTEVAAAPAAPEAVPESVAPADDETTNTSDSLKIKRKGLSAYRTDLNVPSSSSSGTGLNVPN